MSVHEIIHSPIRGFLPELLASRQIPSQEEGKERVAIDIDSLDEINPATAMLWNPASQTIASVEGVVGGEWAVDKLATILTCERIQLYRLTPVPPFCH